MISRVDSGVLAGSKETFSVEKQVKRCARCCVLAVLAIGLLFSLRFISRASANESSGELPVWLIKNNWKHGKGLPKSFRKMHDSTDEIDKAMGKGLDSLNASGSTQCSRENFEAMKSAVGAFKITVLDLRQESHGFINKDLSVSWYQGKDQINSDKSLSEIEADESKRLDDLLQAKTVSVYDLVKPGNDPNAAKTGVDPEKIDISSADTESSICKLEHLAYIRIPVADYSFPANEYVDKFVKFVKSVAPDEWLHIHGGVDDGRTTTFLAMYDMMRNADKVSVVDVIERQQMLGGIDLLQTSGNQDRKIPYMEERANFIQDFYEYCVEQIPHKFSTSWSKWKKKN